ncbi:MAG TPA: aminotransferase class IV [Marinobacter sp.]|nr:aminotransferase class IV [Marinobacter sp.]
MAQLFWAEEGGVPPGDRGLAYGDGLFETILVEGGQAPMLAYHLDRMVRDAARLGIVISRPELDSVFRKALTRYSGMDSADCCIFKFILTRGAGGRGYRPDPGIQPNLLVSRSPAPPRPAPGGVIVDFSRIPLTVNPLFSGIKSLNRLEQVMASRELTGDLFEVLMANSAGHIVEGTRTNLFIETDSGWLTPPVDTLAVAGVMRRWVLERLRAVGEAAKECPVLPEDLLGERCRGVYLTNSVLGVVAVRSLAGQDLPVAGRLATICDPTTTTE